jgi:bifunctional enzyme CysN/CysC
VCDEIADSYALFAKDLGFDTITVIPVSALEGHNIVEAGHVAMSWYAGPSLLQWLETIQSEDSHKVNPFTMPVQWVNRPNLDFRGFSGRVASGSVRPGDSVRIIPSGTVSRIKEIASWAGSQSEASAGQSVTLTLADEIDASRGDVIAAASHPVQSADQFEADLLWLNDHPMLPSRPYGALIHTKSATVTITHIKHRLDVNTGSFLAAKTLGLNEIATVNLSLDRLIPFASYAENKRLGAFILIDKEPTRPLARV